MRSRGALPCRLLPACLSLLVLASLWSLLSSSGLLDSLRLALRNVRLLRHSNFLQVDAEDVWLDRHKQSALRRIQWHDSADNVSLPLCRNTRQGASRIADDRGFVCDRESLDPSGCCAMLSQRFACSRCDRDSGCCRHFEDCVSCCLRPDRKELLIMMLDQTQGHRLRHLLSARDHFELCLIQCRTSSQSVLFENKYRSRWLKHCYKADNKTPARTAP